MKHLLIKEENMRKLIALLLALAMVFSLAACTSSEPTPAEPAEGGDGVTIIDIN